MDIFFGGFLRNSVIRVNIPSTLTTCSTCGSLLYAVDTAFSAFALLAPHVAKLRYSGSAFPKINNII